MGAEEFDRQTNEYNYGIAFLKAFFSFCVVCCHFWTREGRSYPASILGRMCENAVPVFFMISFYLSAQIFINTDKAKMHKRFRRLIFPYFAWGFIYYFGYLICDLILKTVGIKNGLSIDFTVRDLLWQLAFGSDRYLCPQLWFQFDLIVLTALFWIVFRYSKKHSVRIVIALIVMSLAFQYSGLNIRLFGALAYEVRFSTGRIAEVLPLACIGFLLAYTEILKPITAHRLFCCIMCIFSMFTIASGDLFTRSEGFGYGGTYMIAYSTAVFILFNTLSFTFLPAVAKKVIKALSKYSLGVFCIHYGIGHRMDNLLAKTGININSFVKCIIIYFISLLVSRAISIIPSKYAKQLVS